MIIDEMDIFNYVFFPANLSDEKKKQLEIDESFSEAIEFYKQLKLNSESKLPNSVKKILAEKIHAYKLHHVIELYPLIETRHQFSNGSRLAASTKELAPRITTKTFVNKEKEYLIKVMSYENETKVFVFSTNDKIIKDFDIIIKPNDLIFHLENNSEPLVIKQSIDAETIQLKFI